MATTTTTKIKPNLRKTFAYVYNQVGAMRSPMHRYHRDSLIFDEMQKYKPYMDMKTRRPRRLKTALIFIMFSIFGLVGFRIIQWLFVVDFVSGIYGILIGFLVFMAFFASYLFYRDPSSAAAARKTNVSIPELDPLVSIVIATKNEPFLIYDAVSSCLNNTYHNLEIVIVNDGSDDYGTTAAAIDHIVKCNAGRVKAIHLERNKGKRKAMAVGVKQSAEGEIVIFLDSDTIIERDAIKKLVSCMIADPDLGAIVGYCRALNADYNYLTKMQDCWYHSAFTVMKGMEAALGTVTCCSGILSAYRMEALLPCIDPWADDTFLGQEFMAGDDRQLTAYTFGGTKYTLDNNAKQWKTGYCESAISISETPTTMKKFVRQQVRWMQSWFRVFIFTLPWFWKNRNPLSTIYYYLMMCMSFLAPILAIRNLVWMPFVEGTWQTAAIYLIGLTFLSALFAVDFKLYNPKSGNKWVWRIVFTFLSVNILYWLLYYAIYTMRRNDWLTRG
jgi:cellulose synthase/poly-beta-1,6-N-acetylglucosamine synthase-like glycosyltransferase